MISIKFLNVLSVYCVIVKFKLLNVEMVAYHDTVGTTSQNDSLHELSLSSGICLNKIKYFIQIEGIALHKFDLSTFLLVMRT